ncbi:hypothetical protein SY83_20820 [Paenibacillus swuensis]|uniref:DUF2935 domain-containing protein n=2 Tax=Paenibacillus swuensis TaxID=1178515 RepID=A0A172TQ38_9BACL|nr:DUF2935 domain-containing protein [Paenibacillus swuensis]ANE49086.1 hypothetical protein SY83_20820 [Paenibacillus swuensis]
MQTNNEYIESALFEHRFWLQIMGDHARFIYSAFSPKEQSNIEKAKFYVDSYDTFLANARVGIDAVQFPSFNQGIYRLTLEFREFKLALLREHLVGKIEIGLPPTFINHMVNELDEYIRILYALIQGEMPPVFEAIHHHLLWLTDATGHAAAVSQELDPVEKGLILKSMQFEVQFQQFYLKAVELAGFMRTQLHQFPALSRFNKDVELEMLLFKEFLAEIEEMRLTKEALGTLSPLLPDHMAREECYYLLKLAQVSEVKPPACDPTAPRVEV